MIIRNLYKIKIHLFFYIFMTIALLTGNIKNFLIFTFIIIVHETGHIIGGYIFGWDIMKIVILPFGGLTVFNIKINTSLFEQFVVTILGPCFQIVFYLFFCRFFNSSVFLYYNLIVLFFNLLPIYPLDGSKFLFIFLLLFLPFKLCHIILLFISLILIVFFIFLFWFDFLIYLVFLFLFIKVLYEIKNHELFFYKFLFEKYVNDFNFKHVKQIDDIKKMFINCRHIFVINNIYYSERYMLSKKFDKRYKL